MVIGIVRYQPFGVGCSVQLIIGCQEAKQRLTTELESQYQITGVIPAF
jgi:hypothetical protein